MTRDCLSVFNHAARAVATAALLFSLGCSKPAPPPPAAAATTTTPPPTDPQHAGLTAPHGDHTAHRGGIVLMKGDMHTEVVFDRQGHHQVWFTDAVRADLPATVTPGVSMTVQRPGEAPEKLTLAIDENGESWRANGRPVVGDDVTVVVEYVVDGAPYQIELPFFIPVKP